MRPRGSSLWTSFVLALCAQAQAEAAKPPRIGDPCAPGTEGACAEGQMCAPGPGGYCGAFCGFGATCPEGGACVPSTFAGAMCLKRCAADADCRTQEGYACHPDRKVCTHGRFGIAPILPACSEVAPEKRTFAEALRLSGTKALGLYHFEPTAALGKGGRVIAAYTTNGRLGGKNQLATAVISKDGKIEAFDRALVTDRENHFDPWMTSDASGRAHLVWLGFDGGRAPEKRMQIGYAASDDGRTWTKAVAVHDEDDCPNEAPGCLDKPMISAGPAKNQPKKQALYLFYWSEPKESMRARRSLDLGKTFSKSVTVGGGAFGDVFVDAKGDVHVTYVATSTAADVPLNRLGDRRSRIVYVRSVDGGASFSAPITVSAPGETIPFFFSNPQVRNDAARKTLSIVYPRGGPDLRWDIVLAVSKDEGKTWSRVRVDDDAPCAHHMTPAAALDTASGELHLAWTENRTGKGLIAYAACDPKTSTCSKNESVSDAPFSAYELVRHDSRWLGEYYPLLYDPKIKRMHLLWTETVDESGLSTSRIFYSRSK